MKSIREAGLRAGVFAVLLSACASEVPAGPNEPGGASYAVRIGSSDIPVAGLVVRISGAPDSLALTLGQGVMGKAVPLGGGVWRLLVTGLTDTAAFAMVNVSDSLPAPIATVEGAAGGRADGFRAITPGQVHLSVSRR